MSKDAVRHPLVFLQVLILKIVKVVCFDTFLQVFILKGLAQTGHRARSEGGETPDPCPPCFL